MVAAVGRDQFAALGLVRVLPVVKPLFQGLRDGFALADFVLLVVGRGRRQPSFLLRDNCPEKSYSVAISEIRCIIKIGCYVFR